MYHSKKIGVFISHIMGRYQKNVCQGIIDKAREYGYTTEIFTSLDGENLGDYETGEASILRLPNFADFSGVIFAPGTYMQPELAGKITGVLRERCSCPVVAVGGAADTPPFPAVLLENNHPFEELAIHLIRTHRCKRICYLGCASERFYSDLREALCRKTLESAGLSMEPEDACSCGCSEEEAADALTYFLNAETRPDAVICYNDEMALHFMAAALKAGFRIPEDMAVTGCDCTEEGANVSPSLTTVTFPVYELGSAAVEKLVRLIHGETARAAAEVPAMPVYRNSCGCRNSADKNAIFITRALNRRIASLESSMLTSMRMSAAFQHVTDIDEGMELLEQYVRRIEHCSAFYLCLYSGWDQLHDKILELTGSEPEPEPVSGEILLKLAIRDGKRLPECSFRKTSLLPEYLYEAAESAYIYTPLFFEDRKFGYLALAWEDNQIQYHFQLVHWFMNINQMLQRICGELHASQLAGRLEELYATDPLTGLYNRHGLELYGNRLIAGARAAGEPALRFVFTPDGGRTDEFSLKVIGHALSSAARPADICARAGQEEFILLSRGLSVKEADELLERVRQYLENYGRLSSGGLSLSVTGRYEKAY